MASQSDRDVPFDIKKRTFLFAVRIVQLVGRLPRTVAGIEIGRQLIRAGTSVGSNVEEADGAVSRKDFVNHTRIARKEARESRFWLTLIDAADLLRDPEVSALMKEADELARILSKIANRASLGKRPTDKSQ
ncbi:MAG: four helix bundle protein [candidate division NC10 bacterium]|nr:four helix bundle protein [candidate division NC10 bacterium]MBI2164442.1 four helix bundle protein [candidate division NC10 bacterium]